MKASPLKRTNPTVVAVVVYAAAAEPVHRPKPWWMTYVGVEQSQVLFPKVVAGEDMRSTTAE